MSEPEDWSPAIRAMALHVVLLGLVRSHPDPQRLRDLIEPFAEATRTMLNGSTAPDAQIALFDRALGVLLNTLPQASPKAD